MIPTTSGGGCERQQRAAVIRRWGVKSREMIEIHADGSSSVRGAWLQRLREVAMRGERGSGEERTWCTTLAEPLLLLLLLLLYLLLPTRMDRKTCSWRGIRSVRRRERPPSLSKLQPAVIQLRIQSELVIFSIPASK